MAILRNYLIEGQQWIVWKNQMDVSACGRQLFVDAQLNKARSLSGFLRQMETLDPAYAELYKKANQYESLKGEVVVKEKSEKTLPAESSVTINPRWILHDNTGYFFPEGGTLKLETATVTGSWNQVALMYKNESILASIFKLWFDHGIKPDNQNYAYCLVPAATKAILSQMEKNPSFTILKNDTTLQAVVTPDATLGGAIFYKAGKIKLLSSIEVDKPCIVMVEKEKGALKISLSDPTQRLDQIKLTQEGKYKTKDSSISLKTEKGKSMLVVSLPKGGEAGKTVFLNLDIL
jgi:chondroitin AC lyase